MIFIYLLVAGFSVVNSAPICPPSVSVIAGHQKLINSVAVYDGIKPEGAAEYASKNNSTTDEINKRYKSSNVFVCQDQWGNGQVVGNRKTIVTVLHTLYVDRDCNKPRPLNKCVFIYQGGKKDLLFAPAKILASGGCKPGSKLNLADDWAILGLAGELPSDVKPYELPTKEDQLKAGESVVIVGKTSGFKPQGVTGDLMKFPKAFANCVAMGKSSFKFEGLMQTNCPSDPGCSDCALITPGDVPKLKAINRGTIATRDVCVPADNNDDSGAFQQNCRASLAVPVEGAFLEALRRIR